jgi:hypothetical protein
MTGHFKEGVWIEDPKPPREDLVMQVKVNVDDNQVKECLAMLKEMQPLLDRLDRVTQDPKQLTEPNLRIRVDRAGHGEIFLNDRRISHLTSGSSIRNSVHTGNSVIVNIADPNVDLAVELRQVLFRTDKKLFRLAEVSAE